MAKNRSVLLRSLCEEDKSERERTSGYKLCRRTRSVDRPIKRKMIMRTSCRCLSPILHSYLHIVYLRTDYYEDPLTPLTLGSQFSPAGWHSDAFPLMYFFTDIIISLLYFGYVHTLISLLIYFVCLFLQLCRTHLAGSELLVYHSVHSGHKYRRLRNWWLWQWWSWSWRRIRRWWRRVWYFSSVQSFVINVQQMAGIMLNTETACKHETR